ncbi:MAG TPA: RNA polymerase sigma factor RpoD/SigA [Gemmataceae bacterium]|nr:RNA polymerase sigma factor RpoD/SigA [Gemmataceae bacterium]
MKQARRLRKDPSQSPLEIYLRDINETPLLSADEEKELARRIATGDSEARDRMVRANLRLVVNIARGYVGRGLGLQDLIEEGNLGLLRAVEAFDPSMNTRFSTYASYWIKQSIRRALTNQVRLIRLPNYLADLMQKWAKATARLQEELGRAPSPEEVAHHLDLPPDRLQVIRRAQRICQALPQTSSDDEDGWSLEDSVTDPGAAMPDSALAEAEDRRRALELVDQLEPRAALVVRLRFGLDGEEPRTLKEISEQLGLTRERVRQIQNEALSLLNEQL